MKLLAPLALLLCLGAAPAFAQRVTAMDGTKFLALCTGRETVSCEAYINGVADTVATYHDLSIRPNSPVHVPADICVPEVAGTKLREVVVEWLRGHEPERGKPLHQLVYRALLAAYPCK